MATSLALHRLQRSSKRLSITVSALVFEQLESRSTSEGRSLSNLAAYLLETALAAGTSLTA